MTEHAFISHTPWGGGLPLTCQVCPVLYLRAPGGAGAAGKGPMLCGVWGGSRETVSLDPRSPEDPRAHGDPGGLAAAPGGAL